jgi:hypothetical protein
MRTFAVLLAAALTIAFGAGPSEAAKKKKRVVSPAARAVVAPAPAPDRTVVTIDGVTRIIVNRRSYLDAGTEVSPGDRGYTHYVLPPSGDPGRSNWFMGPDVRGAGRWPLPGAYDLPGYSPYAPF